MRGPTRRKPTFILKKNNSPIGHITFHIFKRKNIVDLIEIKIIAFDAQNNKIGKATAVRMERNKILREFYSYCDSAILGNCMETVFDKLGRLHKENRELFGDELDKGNFLYVSEVKIAQKYQGKKLGLFLLKYLFKTEKEMFRFVLVNSKTGMGGNSSDDSILALRKYFRKLGFRRIGITDCMVWFPQPNHWTRKMEDTDNDITKKTPLSADDIELRKQIAKGDLEQVKILVQKGASLEVSGAIALALKVQKKEMVPALMELGAPLNSHDYLGVTPIYAAIQRMDPDSLKYLLSLGADPSKPTVSGFLVTDLFELYIRHQRAEAEFEFLFDYSLPDNYFECLSILSPERKIGRCGCTCQQCIAGFISPRMKTRLLYSCSNIVSDAREEIESQCVWPPSVVCGLSEPLCETTVHSDPLFVNRCMDLHKEFMTLLSQKKPPTFSALKSFLQTDTPDVFLARGGDLFDVVNRIFTLSKDEHEYFGDGSFFHCFEDESEWENIPKCLNDDEYRMVFRMICFRQ